jgi:arabinose-5-phosphate isomerase
MRVHNQIDHPLNPPPIDAIISSARRVIEIESAAVQVLLDRVDADFAGAVQTLYACEGKFIVSGMGKSGLIGRKISATLSCYGIPSVFMHPGEAYHGDLGMIDPRDVVLLISNSGESDEILKLLPFLESQGNKVIAMTGHPESTLAQHAHHHINIAVEQEACPLMLAPTASSTATLVMGDALAVSLMSALGIKEEQFARFHPGGSLGRKLLTTVAHEMVPAEQVPIVRPDTPSMDVIQAMTAGRLGAAIVAGEDQVVRGLITDGDLRRATLKFGDRLLTITAADMMTVNPSSISSNQRILDAETLMEQKNIHQLVVVDHQGRLLGLLPYRHG